MPYRNLDPLSLPTAEKLRATCEDACARLGLSYGDGKRILSTNDDALRNLGAMLINGVPEQVTPALPADYSVHVAMAGGYTIGVLGLGGPDSWYLRVVREQQKFYVGMSSGVIVLAQLFDKNLANLGDQQAADLESALEGLEHTSH
jgi:hypothetical protein